MLTTFFTITGWLFFALMVLLVPTNLLIGDYLAATSMAIQATCLFYMLRD